MTLFWHPCLQRLTAVPAALPQGLISASTPFEPKLRTSLNTNFVCRSEIQSDGPPSGCVFLVTRTIRTANLNFLSPKTSQNTLSPKHISCSLYIRSYNPREMLDDLELSHEISASRKQNALWIRPDEKRDRQNLVLQRNSISSRTV